MSSSDAHDYVLILAWETALNDNNYTCSTDGAAAADHEANIEHESRFTEMHREENEDITAREVESTLK